MSRVPLVSPAEVRSQVRELLAPPDDGSLEWISSTVHRLCGGWQPLVDQALRCGMDPWVADDDPIVGLSRVDSPAARWVERHLMPTLPAEEATFLRVARDLDPFPRELVVDLCPAAATTYDSLHEGSLIVPDTRGELRVVPLIAAVLAVQRGLSDAGPWFAQASSWYLAEGMPGPALRAARYSRDPGRCQSLIEGFGDALIGGGWSGEVFACLPLLSRVGLSVRARMMWAHAARARGRPREAIRIFEEVLGDLKESGDPAPSDLAWRLALCHYGQGDHVRASAYGQGSLLPAPETESTSDRIRRLAGLSATLRASGDIAGAFRAADDAVAAAEEGSTPAEDSGARTTARLQQAMLMRGARRQNHLASALTGAEATGDLFLVQRALVNLAHTHLIGAEYLAARDLARRAVDLVDRTGPVGCFSVALHNEGEALTALGDLRAARARFLQCLDLARKNGQGRTPAPLMGLAECEYQTGRLGDARGAFREAVDVAREWDEMEILVRALGRLATILATEGQENSDETMLAEAVELADEAVRLAPPDEEPAALVARGWAALAAGETDIRERADTAVAMAQDRQVRRALGEALELQAAASTPGRCASAVLQSAVDVHELTGAQCFADRILVTLADLPGGTREQQTVGRAASRRLGERGYSTAPLHPGRQRARTKIDIRVLGSFQVLTDGVPVPTSAWRSRQARTLLKLLVARQGRPICREELCETMWPDDQPTSTRHRLSVLLSSLRSTLDPGRREAAEHFIVVGQNGLSLADRHVDVDLSEFLADAQEAVRLTECADDRAARQLLTRALTEHQGEPFEDDPYESWASEVRDHVRAVRAQSLRLVARLAGRDGNVDDAVTWLERLLGLDPYDEPAHQLLVAVLVRSRRYGAARDAFERWTRATREIGVPAPDPRLLTDGRHEAALTS